MAHVQRALESRIGNLKARRDRLIDAYLRKSLLSEEAYQDNNVAVEADINSARVELQLAKSEASDIRIVVAYAREILQDSSRLWLASPPDMNTRLQEALFPEGISYKLDQGFGTSGTSMFAEFSSLLGEAGEQVVPPTGFEPVFAP